MLSLLPISGLPLVVPGDDLSQLIQVALTGAGHSLQADDIVVVAQKVVSKSEGRLVRLETVTPSPDALALAHQTSKDPRLVELILRESREVVRTRPGLIVVEDVRGFVCANAGIDRSNIEQEGEGETVALLPVDPDASARALRAGLSAHSGVNIGVLVIDSHGRAWREGTVGVTLGAAGVPVLSDRRGDPDLTGYVLQHTVIGIADEIAAAASLLMGPAAEATPVVLVRGLHLSDDGGSAKDLQRARDMDLFR